MTERVVFGLMLVFGAYASLDRQQAIPGVTFQQIANFYTSQNSWLIAFEMDTKPYEYLLQTIHSNLVKVKEEILKIHVEALHPGAPQEAEFAYSLTSQTLIARLQVDFDGLIDYHQQLLDEVARIDSLLSPESSRTSRALLPFLGTVLRGLTGVADQKTVQSIRREITKLAHSGQHIAHVVEEGITILNITRAEVAENRIAFNKVLNLTKRLEARGFEIIRAQQLLEINTWVNQQFSLIRFTLDELALMLTQFNMRLSDLFAGKLTPNILDPAALFKLLQDIQGQIPSGFALPFDIRHELYKYYQQLKCHVEKIEGNFTIVVGIPLSDETSKYHLMQIHTYEIPFDNTSAVATYDLGAEYIIVSPDLSEIMYPDFDDITGCTANGYHICTIHKPILYTNRLLDTCLVALLMDQPDKSSKCPLKVKQRSHGGTLASYEGEGNWIISTLRETTFQVDCGTGQYQLKLKPYFSNITLENGCHAHCADLALPPYFAKTSHYKDLHNIIRYPELPSNWGQINLDLITTQLTSPQQLESILDSQPELDRMHKEVLAELSKYSSPSRWLASVSDAKLDSLADILMIIITVLAIILICVLIYWKCCSRKTVCRGRQDSEATVSSVRLGTSGRKARAFATIGSGPRSLGCKRPWGPDEWPDPPPEFKKHKRQKPTIDLENNLAELERLKETFYGHETKGVPMETDGLRFEPGIGKV